MKRLFQSIVLGTVIAVFALPALAQDPSASPSPQQDEQTAKSDLYKKFLAAYNRGKAIQKEDPPLTKPGNKDAFALAAKEAYDTAKEYVQKYPSPADDILAFQKKYITNYEKSAKEERKNQLTQLIDKDKNYNEAFALGRKILADEPDDLGTNYDLARAGLAAALSNPPNEANNEEAARDARKAIQLIEAGKTFVAGQPIAKKDATLALMQYAYGVTSSKTAPVEAINAFIKAGQLDGPFKTDPLNYYFLAVAYQAGEYEKLAKDFQTNCTTPEQRATDQCKALTDRLNLVVDRIIDAYARSVAYTGNKPEFQKARDEWMKSLTDFYKYRHDGKEDGLKEYIAGITNQPLPGPLPAPGATPAPTSATPSPTPSASTTGSSVSTGTTTMTPAATTAPKTTPAATTTTTAPKTTTTTTAAPKTTTAPKSTPTPKTTTAPKSTPPKKKSHAGRH